MAVTVVSWNIARRHAPWRQLLQMDADVALLQEAALPPGDVMALRSATLPPAEHGGPLDFGPREAWDSHPWNSDWWHGRADALYDRWPMVVRLSDRVDIEWFKQIGPIGWAERDEVAVSSIGMIAVARITPRDGSTEPFIAVTSAFCRRRRTNLDDTTITQTIANCESNGTRESRSRLRCRGLGTICSRFASDSRLVGIRPRSGLQVVGSESPASS